MKTIILFIGLVLAISSPAQTKKIAHRSHSGKNIAFTASMPGNMGIIMSKKEEKKEIKKLKKRYKQSPKHSTDTAKKQDSIPVKNRDTLKGFITPGNRQEHSPVDTSATEAYTGWLALLIFGGVWGIAIPFLSGKKTAAG